MIEELIGFVLMILNGWAAVIYWKTNGIPFWQAALTLTIYWSFTLLITYWLTGGIISIFEKWKPFRVLAERLSEKTKGLKIINSVKEKRARTINWLIKRSGLVIGILAFIPLVPELPTLTIIAARIVKMKNALIILLLGNTFRVFALCYAVYWSLNILSL